jgi:hypothetical protein
MIKPALSIKLASIFLVGDSKITYNLPLPFSVSGKIIMEVENFY